MKKTQTEFTCDLCGAKQIDRPMIEIHLDGPIDRMFIDKHLCATCEGEVIKAVERRDAKGDLVSCGVRP